MNPYAPPQAALGDPNEDPRGRPFLVWVVSILVGFGVLFESVSTLALLVGHPIGGEAATQATAFLGPLDHAATLAIDLLTALAVVALFRLKRSAFPLMLAGFGATVALVLLESLFRRRVLRA